VVLVLGFVAEFLRPCRGGRCQVRRGYGPLFCAWDDLRFVLALFAAAIVGAFVSHRAARAIGPVRAATADWASWTHRDFPMGLALSGTIVFYLLASVWTAA
jgi:prepilin peptidase CpaA